MISGAGLGDAGYVRLVFSGGGVLAIYLAPSLNMLALGDRMARGWASRYSAREHSLCLRSRSLWRSRIDCWPHWFCRSASTQIVRRLVSADLRVLLPLSAWSARFCYYWQILLLGRFSRPRVSDRCHDGVSWCACFCHYGTRMFK